MFFKNINQFTEQRERRISNKHNIFRTILFHHFWYIGLESSIAIFDNGFLCTIELHIGTLHRFSIFNARAHNTFDTKCVEVLRVELVEVGLIMVITTTDDNLAPKLVFVMSTFTRNITHDCVELIVLCGFSFCKVCICHN